MYMLFIVTTNEKKRREREREREREKLRDRRVCMHSRWFDDNLVCIHESMCVHTDRASTSIVYACNARKGAFIYMS